QKTNVDQETKRITNTFQVPGDKVTIKVTKQWNDNNNEAKKRPINITVQLKDGEQIKSTGIVNEENNWTYNFEVPKYNEKGQEINYTADEAKLESDFYQKEEVQGNMQEGYTITNT